MAGLYLYLHSAAGMTVTIIAVNRLVCITTPRTARCRVLVTRRGAAVALTVGYVLASGSLMPPALGTGSLGYDPRSSSCCFATGTPSSKQYVTIVACAIYLPLLVITAACYGRIFWYVRKRWAELGDHESWGSRGSCGHGGGALGGGVVGGCGGSSHRARAASVHSAALSSRRSLASAARKAAACVLVPAAFALLWTPLLLHTAISELLQAPAEPNALAQVSFMLSSLNSVADGAILIATNRSIRVGLVGYLNKMRATGAGEDGGLGINDPGPGMVAAEAAADVANVRAGMAVPEFRTMPAAAAVTVIASARLQPLVEETLD